MNMKTNANIIYCRVIQIVLCQTITIPIEGLWSKRAVKWFRVLWRKWTLKFTDLIYGKILLCSKFFDACTCHAKIAFLKEGAFFSPSCCCIFVLFCGWKQLIICVECVHTKWKMRIRLFFCEGKCQTWIHARCVNVNNERYAHLSDSEEKREWPCVRNTYLCFSKIITKSCNRTHNSHWCQEKFSFLATPWGCPDNEHLTVQRDCIAFCKTVAPTLIIALAVVSSAAKSWGLFGHG